MKIISLRSKSILSTEVVNFLILVTFKIKDFIGHYLKLVAIRGYTQLGLINKDYLNENYIIEVKEHITN